MTLRPTYWKSACMQSWKVKLICDRSVTSDLLYDLLHKLHLSKSASIIIVIANHIILVINFVTIILKVQHHPDQHQHHQPIACHSKKSFCNVLPADKCMLSSRGNFADTHSWPQLLLLGAGSVRSFSYFWSKYFCLKDLIFGQGQCFQVSIKQDFFKLEVIFLWYSSHRWHQNKYFFGQPKPIFPCSHLIKVRLSPSLKLSQISKRAVF